MPLPAFALPLLGAAIQAAGAVAASRGGSNKLKQVSNFSPQQQGLHEMLGGQLGGASGNALDILRQYLDPESDIFQNFEAPYMRQFNEETVPNLAERFAGAGALSSSGFGQALSSAGAGLQENLAGLKTGMQRNSIQDILGLLQNYMGQQPFSFLKKNGKASPLASFASNFNPFQFGQGEYDASSNRFR